jgi:hypothetical protein
MRRPITVMLLVGVGMLAAFGLLLSSPGSLRDALSHPFVAILGTQRQLNATLLDVSESSDPVLAAGRRLLKPFGMVRLSRIYSPTDSDNDHPAKR